MAEEAKVEEKPKIEYAMVLSYCDQCSPAVALAAGHLPAPAKHRGQDGVPHEGKLVVIDAAEAPSDAEVLEPGVYLARLLKKYVTKQQ